MPLINANSNYLEVIPQMSDADLMHWAAQARYDEGAEPKAVAEELLDRGFVEGDINDEYDRFLAYRSAQRRADNEEYNRAAAEAWGF